MYPPKVGVVYDEGMLLHRNHVDEKFPERPERVMAIYLKLLKTGIWCKLTRVEAVPAEEEILSLVHTKSHIEKVRNTIYSSKTSKGKKVLLKAHENSFKFSSTYENNYTATSAYLAAGGAV